MKYLQLLLCLGFLQMEKITQDIDKVDTDQKAMKKTDAASPCRRKWSKSAVSMDERVKTTEKEVTKTMKR